MSETIAFKSCENQIESGETGFLALCRIAEGLEKFEFTPITLDMKHVDWFDANLSSVLGALLHKAYSNFNSIRIVGLSFSINEILLKNNFLSYHGGEKRQDTYSTTVQYLHFQPGDDRSFVEYLERDLMGKSLPIMSDSLHRAFISGLMEVFNNSVIHSETTDIFTCGQFYPKKHRVDFTITDLGIGIKENIKKHCGYEYSADAAIEWAMAGNSTKLKKNKIPGGLGLQLVREFIRINQGCIQILSNNGFWQQSRDGSVIMELFPFHFPGTVVNISINTNDPYTYRLSSDVHLDEIF